MMKCPFCGAEEGYYFFERVHRALCFTFEGVPDGGSEDYSDACGKRKYCRECHKILPKKMFVDEN